MKKVDFIALMSAAIADKANYIGFVIEMPNMEAPEFIINPGVNAEEKLKYMIEAYDDNMCHKHAEGVRLKKLIATNLLVEITYALLDETVETTSNKGLLPN